LRGTAAAFTPMGERKSVKILGAIELWRTRFDYRQDTVFNAATYLGFLEQLARRYRRQGAILILDNASYHKDADVWAWFKSNRHWLEVHQLPPYSPVSNILPRGNVCGLRPLISAQKPRGKVRISHAAYRPYFRIHRARRHQIFAVRRELDSAEATNKKQGSLIYQMIVRDTGESAARRYLVDVNGRIRLRFPVSHSDQLPIRR